MLEATRSASRRRRLDVTAENSTACGVRDERRPGSDAVRSIYCGLREGGSVWVFMVGSKRRNAGVDKKGGASGFRVAERLRFQARKVSALLVMLPSPACSQSQRILAAIGAKPCRQIVPSSRQENRWEIAHACIQALMFTDATCFSRFLFDGYREAACFTKPTHRERGARVVLAIRRNVVVPNHIVELVAGNKRLGDLDAGRKLLLGIRFPIRDRAAIFVASFEERQF